MGRIGVSVRVSRFSYDFNISRLDSTRSINRRMPSSLEMASDSSSRDVIRQGPNSLNSVIDNHTSTTEFYFVNSIKPHGGGSPRGLGHSVISPHGPHLKAIHVMVVIGWSCRLSDEEAAALFCFVVWAPANLAFDAV